MQTVKPLKVKLWKAKPSKFRVDDKLHSGQASGMDRILRLTPSEKQKQSKNVFNTKASKWTGQDNK